MRHIGVTSYWPGLLARVLRAFPVDCVLNYCHANLFVDDMEEVLAPQATAAEAGILNASPLHMGLLSDKPLPEWHPAPTAVRNAAQEVRTICQRFGVDSPERHGSTLGASQDCWSLHRDPDSPQYCSVYCAYWRGGVTACTHPSPIPLTGVELPTMKRSCQRRLACS